MLEKIIIYVSCALMAMLTIMVLVSTAESHEWYDKECCSDQDCRVIEPGDDMQVNKTGYVVMGFQIDFDDPRVRKSKDKDFHVCAVQDEVGHPVIRCLYEPSTGDLF